MAQPLIRRGLLMTAAIACVLALNILPVGGGGAISAGIKVVVTVVTDPSDPNPLQYRWRSTDGVIINKNQSSTEWTLPAGPGIHFAYVLVSNGKGGYTERRISVNTDTLSDRRSISRPPMDLVPPRASAVRDVPFRHWLGGGAASYTLGGEGRFGRTGGVTSDFKVAVPDVKVTATDNDSLTQESISTSSSGDFTLRLFGPNPNSGEPRDFSGFTTDCMLQGVSSLSSPFDISRCFGVDASNNPIADEVIDREANQTNRIDLVPSKRAALMPGERITWVTGRVLLEDGSACGTENEFFGIKSTATAELQDGRGNTIPGSLVAANSWGQFSIGVSSFAAPDLAATSVVGRCEGAASVGTSTIGRTIPALSADTDDSLDIGFLPIVGVRPPVVKSMFVTPAIIQKFKEPETGLPSDIVPLRPAKFLAMKGLDTRLSGCLYYKTIGAVRDCDPQGNYRQEDAISFEDWKRAVKIDEYARFTPPGTVQQSRALFVNKVDLNLTRDHHFVSHLAGTKAGYVCNHLGPDPTISDHDAHQNDVDKTIQNAAARLNLVACVAMDYAIWSGVNVSFEEPFTAMPFIRFLIFGPSGELLPSVNLDELGEKFVPGACVVCHGGNKYAGKFPEDGSGTADLEAHFLPFDVGNFEFHSGKGGLTITDQEGRKLLLKKDADVKEGQDAAISRLNDLLLSSAPGIGFFGFDKGINQAEKELIVGWYKSGLPVQDINFVPDGTMDSEFYLKVIARNCRTCHIAQRDQESIKDLNFSKQGNNLTGNKPGAANRRIDPITGAPRPITGESKWLEELVCGQTNDLVRAYAMPNSKVTFDLFWGSPEAMKEFREQTGITDCANPKATQSP